MNMTRNDLFELFRAGVERGRDEAIAEDWGNRAPGNAEGEFVKTLLVNQQGSRGIAWLP